MLKNHVTYFEGKHLIEGSTDWIAKNQHIYENVVEKSIFSETAPNISLYNSFQTKFFALDIDDHRNTPIDLEKTYIEVFYKIGEPSFLIKSPHGYHAYYLLSDYCSSQSLVSSIIKKVRKLKNSKNIEVKPTHNNGLRAPNFMKLVNTRDLNKRLRLRPENLDQFLTSAIHYQASEFLSEQELSNSVKVVPSDIICAGSTNIAMNYYVPIWKTSGMSPEEATEKFISCLDPQYDGECKNYHRVLKRVQCYYRFDLSKPIVESKSMEELEENYMVIIAKVLSQYHNKNKHNEHLRKASIKEDLLKILLFFEKSWAIFSNNELKFEHNEKHPYFIHEMNRKCIPIASSAIRVKNMSFFKSIGLITLPYGRHYSVEKHSCIHYQVNLDKFMDIKPELDLNSSINIKYNNILQNTSNSFNSNCCFNLFVYQNEHVSDNEDIITLQSVVEAPKIRKKWPEAVKFSNLDPLFI